MSDDQGVDGELASLRQELATCGVDDRLSHILDRILGILSGHEAALTLLRAETSGEPDDEELDADPEGAPSDTA